MNVQAFPAPTVGVGSTVSIRDLESHEVEMYMLTGPNDADIRQNYISTMSPIGRALYGRRPGEIVEFSAPGGAVVVEIVDVDPNADIEFARDG